MGNDGKCKSYTRLRLPAAAYQDDVTAHVDMDARATPGCTYRNCSRGRVGNNRRDNLRRFAQIFVLVYSSWKKADSLYTVVTLTCECVFDKINTIICLFSTEVVA